METITRQKGVLANGYTFNLEGFEARVDRLGINVASPECWPFKGGKTKGYGVVITTSPTGQQTSTTASRVMYELETGRVPSGALRAVCGNRHCVNPAHMEEKGKKIA